MPRLLRRSLVSTAAALLVTGVMVGAATDAPGSPQPGTPRGADASTWIDYAVGTFHGCAIRSDHTTWCWGGGASCELGDGNCHSSSHPVEATERTDWQSVMAGHDDTCATSTDETLWCWGLGTDGQLGYGGERDLRYPSEVPGTWMQVAASPGGDRYRDDKHTCGIQTHNTLWCWGQNSSGQLGVGDRVNRLSPVQVGHDTGWIDVSAGDDMTCGVRFDLSLWCWGKGQLGNGGLGHTNVPEQVGTRTDWWRVSTSGFNTCALTVQDRLWCWGINLHGEVGNGNTTAQPTPARVNRASWASVHVGYETTCGIRKNHTAWCWGFDDKGQLGTGEIGTLSAVPVEVQGGPAGWQSVVVTYESACGFGTDSTLWCWGSNQFGQLAKRKKKVAESGTPLQVAVPVA